MRLDLGIDLPPRLGVDFKKWRTLVGLVLCHRNLPGPCRLRAGTPGSRDTDRSPLKIASEQAFVLWEPPNHAPTRPIWCIRATGIVAISRAARGVVDGGGHVASARKHSIPVFAARDRAIYKLPAAWWGLERSAPRGLMNVYFRRYMFLIRGPEGAVAADYLLY